ncbi:hypothetical protein HZH68_011511 [Vespula germanica]|uniref:Uncharacterized protein n=1 Tax=Vespula germanica TaxID=30212 RepID=A0A834N2M4_VESGE|nr:hypothetical protein HZH68_011511 [Vespula germanica]
MLAQHDYDDRPSASVLTVYAFHSDTAIGNATRKQSREMTDPLLSAFSLRCQDSSIDDRSTSICPICPVFSTQETRNCLVDPDTPDKLAPLNRFKRPRK